jgi:hypothetical protein
MRDRDRMNARIAGIAELTVGPGSSSRSQT